MADIYSVLITGANRGIGLEFVKQFLTNPLVRSHAVIAACRSPDQAAALQELKKSHPQLHLIKLDVAQFDSYDDAVNAVRDIVGDKGLTLLINNAGVNPKAHSLDKVTPDDYLSTLKINSVAPVFLSKAFLPLIKVAAQVNAAKSNNSLSVTRAAIINVSSLLGSIALLSTYRPPHGKFWAYRESLGVTRAAIINISSFLGSIALNEPIPNDGFWAYRESKASLNMSTHSLALELEEDGILVEAIHPGHVVTDMGGPDAPVDTVGSVTGMLEVLLSRKEKNRKGFASFDGQDLPY